MPITMQSYNVFTKQWSNVVELPTVKGEIWINKSDIKNEITFDHSEVNSIFGITFYIFKDKYGAIGLNEADLLKRYEKKKVFDPWQKQKDWAAEHGFTWKEEEL